ncbi:MAG TPA: DUF885 domain-containing protein [Thermoanaerobaculia bacterium]|jgi:uncharacterized protein (DUF885 family)|nr:DUF885 domain-containing protein [Thermoanaerobaculia bacterium]
MRRLLFLPLLLTLACNMNQTETKAPAAARQAAADAAPIVHAYVIEFLRHNPSVNTYLGGAGLDPSLEEADGRLRDHSQAAIDGEDRWLSETQQQLEAAAQSTDRDVALAQIRYQLHLHQVRKHQHRSVDTYTDEPFRAIDFQLQGMTQTGASTYGTPEEWALVVNRLNAIPRYLATAQAQMRAGIEAKNSADFRMLYRNGVKTSESTAKYFETTMPKLAEERIAAGPQREQLLVQIREGSAKAARAFTDFRNFVASTYFDDASKEAGIKQAFAGDRYAFGETEYNWALKNNLRIDKTAAQLYEEAWPIVEQTQRDMAALAREIGAKHHWPLPADDKQAVRAVIDQLGKDYPRSDAEMVQWYKDAAFRLVDYSRKTGLFDVPADYKLEVVETPPPLRASIDGAAYYPAPPFKTTGVGRYYVSPTDNDPAMLRENNRSALADLSAHEGFPGHDWYYKVLQADKPSPVRWLTPGAVEDSSSMWEDSMPSEGWGLYAEALMAEPRANAPNGFYTPEERLYQLQGKLYRDLRVRVDTGIHTGKMTYDDAVDLFSQVVDFQPGSCRDATLSEGKRASCTTSEKAIFRYSKWPTQAITYRLGKDEIYALRNEAKQKLGEKFDLRKFHLLFIKQGTIPTGYFRDELMKQLGAQ